MTDLLPIDPQSTATLLLCGAATYLLARLMYLSHAIRELRCRLDGGTERSRVAAFLAEWEHPRYFVVHFSLDMSGDVSAWLATSQGDLFHRTFPGAAADLVAVEWHMEHFAAHADGLLRGDTPPTPFRIPADAFAASNN